MILISKKEAMKLSTMGVNYGENGISKSGRTKGRMKYYLCESYKNLNLLKSIRNA